MLYAMPEHVTIAVVASASHAVHAVGWKKPLEDKAYAITGRNAPAQKTTGFLNSCHLPAAKIAACQQTTNAIATAADCSCESAVPSQKRTRFVLRYAHAIAQGETVRLKRANACCGKRWARLPLRSPVAHHCRSLRAYKRYCLAWQLGVASFSGLSFKKCVYIDRISPVHAWKTCPGS